MAIKLTKRQVERIRQDLKEFFQDGDEAVADRIFNDFDLDHDGNVIARELSNVMKNVFDGVTGHEIQKMIAEADRDQSGTIEKGEFINILKRYKRGGSRSSVGWARLNIYEEIGGEQKVNELAYAFSKTVGGDMYLRSRFDGYNIEHTAAALFIFLFETEKYRGRPIDQVHAGMRITHEDLDRFAQLFYETCIELGQTKEISERIRDLINSHRDQIVRA